jgi:hypothetical protein
MLLLRLRASGGACLGYCLLTGDFLFVTKECSKHLLTPNTFGTCGDLSLLYGQSLYTYLAPLDSQRLHQYIDDAQAQIHYYGEATLSKMIHSRMNVSLLPQVPAFFGTVEGTGAVISLDMIITPLTLRLQRCVDALVTADGHCRFSDESVFVINDEEYKSVIANDAYQIASSMVDEDAEALHTMGPPTEVEAPLADFAFAFQAEWDDQGLEVKGSGAHGSKYIITDDAMCNDQTSNDDLSPMAVSEF